MKQQRVGRINGFVLGVLVGRTTAKVLIGPEGSWEWARRFQVCCQTDGQIDRQRERMAQDKLNSVRIKPTIATLIQPYNTAIISG